MNCPSCSAAMTTATLDGHLGAKVELNLCPTCQVIWFDHMENLRLAPSGTLALFRVIGDRSQLAPVPINQRMSCPRCGLRLLWTQDRQRNTPFHYWRCAREHGRIESFFDFLREKDFIHPLSPQQLAELRQNVQMINCSNCGAPIDLVNASACAHCGTPISMLDVEQIAQQIATLTPPPLTQQAGTAAVPSLGKPQPSAGEQQDVRALFEALRTHESWNGSSSVGLVEAGLWMVAKWLS